MEKSFLCSFALYIEGLSLFIAKKFVQHETFFYNFFVLCVKMLQNRIMVLYSLYNVYEENGNRKKLLLNVNITNI